MTTPAGRLAGFVGTWEPSLAREFSRYDRLLRSKALPPPSAWGETEGGPYWKELPRWLVERHMKGRKTVSPGFLDTVLWGQVCLFYAVRIQDDLLDGDLPRSSLTVGPLLFLTEAQRVFSSVFASKAAFWKGYRLAVNTTVAGITTAARMQRKPAARAADLLKAYGCVDAVLSVASSATCERMGAVEEIPHINAFVRELGKVLLALDDAEDIEEDLRDGRLNYAARVLIKAKPAGGADLTSLARTWRLHSRPEGVDEFKATLLGCLTRAAAAIAPLGLAPTIDLIKSTKEAVHGTKPFG